MAVMGENSWPYVQFRGGPKDFLRVIADSTLGLHRFLAASGSISLWSLLTLTGPALIFINTVLGIIGRVVMGTAVKKTISLPPDLAEEAENTAREEGKTLSAVIQDALRLSRRQRLTTELRDIQGYWSGKAKERGVLTEVDLEKFLQG